MSTSFTPPRPDEWQGPAASFTPPPPSSWQGPAPETQQSSAIQRFGSGLWATTVGGLKDTAVAALDLARQAASGQFDPNSVGGRAAIGLVQSHIDQAEKAKQALQQGRYSEAVGHSLATVLPLIGPAAANAGETIGEGDVAGGLGQATGLIGSVLAPKAVPKVVEVAAPALRTAADVTGAATKAGGRDVAVGAAKTAAGAALAKAGPLGEIADVIAGLPIMKSGLKQMQAGFRAGYAAGREAAAASRAVPPDVEVLPPLRKLPPGPVITPPPPDTSYVRGVPAEYAQPEPLPPSRQLPAASTAIVTPPPADTSYVRAVAAQYPEVIPPELRGGAAPAPPPAPTPQALALRQAMEELQRRKAAAAAIPAEAGKMTPAEAAADFAQRRATMLEQPPAETAFQEQKARIQEGMTPPEETPPPAAPGGAVLPAGSMAVPEGSVVRPTMPAAIPEHYADLYTREGEVGAARAFVKDQRIARYLLDKGITSDQFAAMPLEQQNKLIVEAPAASAKGRNRPFVQYAEGQLRSMGRGADEGISHITDTMRWMERQQEAPGAVAPPTPPAAVEPPPALPTKEPWQMSRAEFIATYPERTRAAIRTEVQRNVSALNQQIETARRAIQSDPGNPANAAIQSGIDAARAKIAEQNARLTTPIRPLEEIWSPEQIRWHHVEGAMREGKPIPAEVLADYPELQTAQAATVQTGVKRRK